MLQLLNKQKSFINLRWSDKNHIKDKHIYAINQQNVVIFYRWRAESLNLIARGIRAVGHQIYDLG